ncbi:MAG TPA: hypothetical protein PKO15_11510 [Fibrobacteria bacterium]|nr:hypothetical protein [Fibrobacteria bacterium]HOX50424.1 hypothetical protein [Fibrobacteria bacterium]
MLWPLLASLLLASDAPPPTKGEMLLVWNSTGSNHNLVGMEVGAGYGFAKGDRSTELLGLFGSVEPGWRGWRLRTGIGALMAGEGGIAVWRIGVVGLSDGWSTDVSGLGPELTLGYNLILLRAGMAFGEAKPVRFLWSAGLGI